MTMRVDITNTDASLRARVRFQTYDPARKEETAKNQGDVYDIEIGPGETSAAYIHDGRRLIVEEVAIVSATEPEPYHIAAADQ